ncbi:MAG: hypothetical protein EZS28_041099 [Streblomastix strix]|uniref:Uncharacterized protein n=1 Tax=Streblomastix strix TaxID=222440 RepID=A0A5J4U104_9EUKA|nr:MAG: hypothetical protein EZS28_041099 [Streblomastix strix]
MIQSEKEVSALEAQNKHRRDNLDKENETRTLEKERIELARTSRNDYIDSNPTLQVDQKTPQSPHLPSYLQNNQLFQKLKNDYHYKINSKLNFTYLPPNLANNNLLSFFDQQVINNRNRVNQPLQQPMLPENPTYTNSPQVQYQIREVDPQEEEDLDKQNLQLQEERNMIQLRFEQEVYDTVFGDIDYLSDLNNNEMDKQSQ